MCLTELVVKGEKGSGSDVIEATVLIKLLFAELRHYLTCENVRLYSIKLEFRSLKLDRLLSHQRVKEEQGFKALINLVMNSIPESE